MATYYSDHFSADIGSTGHFTTLSTTPKIVSAGKKHGRVRKSIARLLVPNATDLGSGDIIRLIDFKSSDRIGAVYFAMDTDWGATTTFECGIYKKGSNNDGASVDFQLFMKQATAAVDWSGPITRTDYFKSSTKLTDYDRWQPLWYQADLGDATYTADPKEQWTLAITTSANISAAAGDVSLMCEVEYLAGD